MRGITDAELLYKKIYFKPVRDFAKDTGLTEKAVYQLVKIEDFPTAPWGKQKMIVCPDAFRWLREHVDSLYQITRDK